MAAPLILRSNSLRPVPCRPACTHAPMACCASGWNIARQCGILPPSAPPLDRAPSGRKAVGANGDAADGRPVCSRRARASSAMSGQCWRQYAAQALLRNEVQQHLEHPSRTLQLCSLQSNGDSAAVTTARLRMNHNARAAWSQPKQPVRGRAWRWAAGKIILLFEVAYRSYPH